MRSRLPAPPWFLAVLLTLPAPAGAAADPPPGPGPGPLKIVTPKPQGIIAIALNGRGDLIGFEWAEDPMFPGVLEQKPFLQKGGAVTYLPVLTGYTATFPAAVSDEGLVVGRSSKPAPLGVRVPLRNQAFVWEAATGMRGLGTLPGDFASFATGVSRDGRRVAGFSVGDPGMRPCLWERQGPEGGWKIVPLPHENGLGSNVVALSGDGRRASAIDGTVPCLWTLGDDGKWTREAIGGPTSLVPRGVNDSGTVVGFRNTDQGTTHAVVWSRAGGLQVLKEPEGYVKSEALAVNNEGLVVGMVDGPNGSPIGPNAFAYQGGQLRIIREGGPWFTTATAVNDRGEIAGVFEADEEAVDPPSDPKDAPKKP